MVALLEPEGTILCLMVGQDSSIIKKSISLMYEEIYALRNEDFASIDVNITNSMLS